MRSKLWKLGDDTVRKCSRSKEIRTPPPIRVTKNYVAHLGSHKKRPKPCQLLSLPPFPGHPLPGRSSAVNHVTAISWLKYYFDEVPGGAVHSHFNKGLVQMDCMLSGGVSSMPGGRKMNSMRKVQMDCRVSGGASSMPEGRKMNSMRKVQMDCMVSGGASSMPEGRKMNSMRKVMQNEIMELGSRIYVPASVAETKITKRFDIIPSGTLNPNADEIKYLKRLVFYKDSALIVLNKPPKLPVKGNLPIHNSMDALAAAALSYDYNEGPKLVHRLDRESSGLLLMGRTKESVAHLHLLFSDLNKAKSVSKAWDGAREVTYQRYWALVIGCPKEKEGLICAPLTKVMLDDGKTERVMLANCSGFEASYEAFTEYRVLGPMINGCSWIELCPRTSQKHQLRVHCAEALGTPIVGDYKYGWFVHSKWKQMPRVDFEPSTGEPYKMRRPEGLDVQRGSVLSNVPLLHLHCREFVLPNIEKILELKRRKSDRCLSNVHSKPDVLRFVASMPSHMKISWSLMSSYMI